MNSNKGNQSELKLSPNIDDVELRKVFIADM